MREKPRKVSKALPCLSHKYRTFVRNPTVRIGRLLNFFDTRNDYASGIDGMQTQTMAQLFKVAPNWATRMAEVLTSVRY